jgi:hypothetical protein
LKASAFAFGFTVGGGIGTLDGVVVQQALIETVMTRIVERKRRLPTIDHHPLAL